MTEETIIHFPCRFPIKIIGSNSPSFMEQVKETTLRFFPDLIDSDISHKMSGNNNYLAITVVIYAENKAKLDSLYQALTKLDQVKMVL